ncbi:hypothetical protein SOASR015_25140 [Pectobacterium carotovorum subsp. carotovorum]|nr:hypothetical protein SOASR015_25140 [Pectobacterium carotovorum subsp. carotovorum]GLX55326.1 hypothetical protein Pcaca02_06350 [Pectobacterium carotovorum subsp. carotovorum]
MATRKKIAAYEISDRLGMTVLMDNDATLVALAFDTPVGLAIFASK